MTTPDPEGRTDVPIVVPDQSKSTKTNRQSGPAIHTPDYTVIAPVPGDDHWKRGIETEGRIDDN